MFFVALLSDTVPTQSDLQLAIAHDKELYKAFMAFGAGVTHLDLRSGRDYEGLRLRPYVYGIRHVVGGQEFEWPHLPVVHLRYKDQQIRPTQQVKDEYRFLANQLTDSVVAMSEHIVYDGYTESITNFGNYIFTFTNLDLDDLKQQFVDGARFNMKPV